jgi:hypothetical protein
LNEALLKPLFPETHNLVHDWYLFFHYLLLTWCGFFIASMRGMWDRIAAMRFVSLASAVAIICIVVPLVGRGVIHRGTPVDAVITNVFTWLSILAFLGYARRYLSFGNEFLRWAREAAYPVYILHQTLMLMLAYWIIQLDWSPWTKYWVVLAGTMSSSVALYQFAIRPFSPVRVLFGLKAGSKRNAGTLPSEPSTVPASS